MTGGRGTSRPVEPGTPRQQIEALRDSIAENQSILDFIVDAQAEIINAQRMLSLLSGHAEDILNPERGQPHPSGGVTLVMQHDGIDLALWAIDNVWSALKDLDGRLNVRINALIAAENAAKDPRAAK